MVGFSSFLSKINSKSPTVPLCVGGSILLVKIVPKSIMDLTGTVFIDVLFIIEKQDQNQFEHQQMNEQMMAQPLNTKFSDSRVWE